MERFEWHNVVLTTEGLTVDLPGGGRPILTQQGEPIKVIAPGWEPDRLLRLADMLSLAQFRHEDGRKAGWLLDDSFRLLGDIEELSRNCPGHVRDCVAKAMACFRKDLFAGSLLGNERGVVLALQKADQHLVDALWLMSSFSHGVKQFHLAGTAGGGVFVLPDPRIDIEIERLGFDPTSLVQDFIAGAHSPELRVPSLCRDGFATVSKYFPLGGMSDNIYALLCLEEEESLVYLRFFVPFKANILYFPQSDITLSIGEAYDLPFYRRVLDIAADFFFSLRDDVRRRCLVPAGRAAVVLRGVRNFGHCIWNEFQSLERVLERRKEWRMPPFVYVIVPESGATLYGPIEDLYPELAGQIFYMNSIAGAFVHAVENSAQLYRLDGEMSFRATRQRLMRMVEMHGRSTDLMTTAARLIHVGGARRAVIVLGLRLTNRTPHDTGGLYARLTRALVDRLGPLVIVIDGLNREKGQDRAAADVFNPGLTDKRGRHSQGQMELQAELEFVEEYRRSVADLPVTIVSCVATPIRDNLFWMSQADFFVAPNGGGLAKLRWALDIPGYVMTSRINFEYCRLVNLYADPKYTEGPVQPVYMNLPSEVEDLPLDPPRTGPASMDAIPHPENFILDEGSAIPHICDLAARHYHDAGAAPSSSTADEIPPDNRTTTGQSANVSPSELIG